MVNDVIATVFSFHFYETFFNQMVLHSPSLTTERTKIYLVQHLNGSLSFAEVTEVSITGKASQRAQCLVSTCLPDPLVCL